MIMQCCYCIVSVLCGTFLGQATPEHLPTSSPQVLQLHQMLMLEAAGGVLHMPLLKVLFPLECCNLEGKAVQGHQRMCGDPTFTKAHTAG